jgi:hypothetical protein
MPPRQRVFFALLRIVASLLFFLALLIGWR